MSAPVDLSKFYRPEQLPAGYRESCANCGHSPEAHVVDEAWKAHNVACMVCGMFGDPCPGFQHRASMRLS